MSTLCFLANSEQKSCAVNGPPSNPAQPEDLYHILVACASLETEEVYTLGFRAGTTGQFLLDCTILLINSFNKEPRPAVNDTVNNVT